MKNKVARQYDQLVNDIFHKYFKPIGYKKENQNFRFYQNDGLGKIVNFQRSWCNTKNECTFIINVGIYFEENSSIENLKFKECQCRISERPGKWWVLENSTDITVLFHDFCIEIENVILPFLKIFTSKQMTLAEILIGHYPLSYNTAEFLVTNGYGREILPQLLEQRKNKLFADLIVQVQSNMEIPILEDTQLYEIYIVLKKEKHDKEELKVFSTLCNIDYMEASRRLKKNDRLIAKKDAFDIKKIRSQLDEYGINYEIIPPYPYE